jgi:hypothetical protein
VNVPALLWTKPRKKSLLNETVTELPLLKVVVLAVARALSSTGALNMMFELVVTTLSPNAPPFLIAKSQAM